jgi:hypothetical protein
MKKENNYWDILDECSTIAKERGDDYGSVADNFKDICDIHFAIWGEKIDMQHVAKLFVSTKMSRDKNKNKKDNIVDNVNYLCILQYFRDNSML